MLGRARDLGFLGPGPIGPHVDRALDLDAAIPHPPQAALDLGSGGGLPGLPLALLWTRSEWVLLDASARRTAFLGEAVGDLGLDARVRVVGSRAEEAGRTELRASFDLVVARSFAAPAVTAECGSPFLRVGGRLIVAEPPGGSPERWDPSGLTELGLRLEEASGGPTSYQSLVQVAPCPERYPRRVGIPAKRPLF